MKLTKYILPLVVGGFLVTTASNATEHDEKQDHMNAGNAPTMDLETSRWGLRAPPPTGFGIPTEAGAAWGYGLPPAGWSIFDPFLLDMPDGGKGIPVHDANDASKIIGYVKMPERPKPTGPVHCSINEKALLAQSVDDCEAAGGTVAGQ